MKKFLYKIIRKGFKLDTNISDFILKKKSEVALGGLVGL